MWPRLMESPEAPPAIPASLIWLGAILGTVFTAGCVVGLGLLLSTLYSYCTQPDELFVKASRWCKTNNCEVLVCRSYNNTCDIRIGNNPIYAMDCRGKMCTFPGR